MSHARLPGRLLLRIAAAWCEDIARERVIEPLIADLQREWLAADGVIERLAVRTRGSLAFAVTLAGLSWQVLQRELSAPLPLDVVSRASVGLAVGLGAGILAECLTLPTWSMPIPINPSTVTFAATRGLLLGVVPATLLAMLRARATASRPRMTDAVKLALAAALLTTAAVGWAGPLASRAFGLRMAERQRNAAIAAGNDGSWRPDLAVLANPANKTWPQLIRDSRVQNELGPRNAAESRRRLGAVALAVSFAFLGWMLGASRHARTWPRAVMGWTLGWFWTRGGTLAGSVLVPSVVLAVLLWLACRERQKYVTSAPDATARLE